MVEAALSVVFHLGGPEGSADALHWLTSQCLEGDLRVGTAGRPVDALQWLELGQRRPGAFPAAGMAYSMAMPAIGSCGVERC